MIVYCNFRNFKDLQEFFFDLGYRIKNYTRWRKIPQITKPEYFWHNTDIPTGFALFRAGAPILQYLKFVGQVPLESDIVFFGNSAYFPSRIRLLFHEMI